MMGSYIAFQEELFPWFQLGAKVTVKNHPHKIIGEVVSYSVLGENWVHVLWPGVDTIQLEDVAYLEKV